MTRELLHSATLMTVDTGDRVVEDGFLVIEDGRIADLGPAARQPGPAGFDRVTDLSGRILEALKEGGGSLDLGDEPRGEILEHRNDQVVADTDTAIEVGKCPVRNLIEVVARVYGQDHRSASLRVAQVMGSAIGWRLFEPYLVASAGLDDMPLTEVRLELTRIHRWIGATPYPSPPDPPMLT